MLRGVDQQVGIDQLNRELADRSRPPGRHPAGTREHPGPPRRDREDGHPRTAGGRHRSRAQQPGGCHRPGDRVPARPTSRPSPTIIRTGSDCWRCSLAVESSGPLSTRERACALAAFAVELGDDALARRLVRIGIARADDYATPGGERPGPDPTSTAWSCYHQWARRSAIFAPRRVESPPRPEPSIVCPGGSRNDDRHRHPRIPRRDPASLRHDLREIEVDRDYGDLPLDRRLSGTAQPGMDQPDLQFHPRQWIAPVR